MKRVYKNLLYETMYGEGCIVFDKALISDYIKERQTISEVSQVQGVYSDEGLYDFFASFKDYKRVTAANALKVLGWPVIEYMLDKHATDPSVHFDMMQDDGPKGKEGRVDTNTYGGAVVAGERSYKKADKMYMKEMDRIIKDLGWDIINWMGIGPNRTSKVVIIPSNNLTVAAGKVNEDIVMRIQYNETIKKVDGDYVVYPKKGGKRLGSHKSKKKALAQLKAIELSKREIKEQENNIEKLVAIYPGRFQPFGPHHLASYNFLKKRYDEVYIVTSNKTGGARHPMSFSQKKKHMMRMGVPSKAIVQENQPYIPKGLLSKYDEETTAVVFAVGEKDEGRLTGGKYFKPYRQNYNRLQGFKHHGYTLQLPHTSIKVGGMEISGTTMRKLLGSNEFDIDAKKKFFKKMFGYFDDKTFELFTTSFNEAIKLNVDVGDTILVGKFKNKKMKVKTIGTDDHGMPTINGRKATTFRYVKEPNIFKENSLSECITFAKKFGDNIVLGKNRDRNYSPNLRVVRELTGYGVELCYVMDNDTDWCEGINSYGIGLVNSALFVKRDEKEFDKTKKVKAMSKDGTRIREALGKKTLKEAVESAIKYEGGIKGHTIISDGKKCIVIENTSRTSPAISIYDINKNSLVRTNHGIEHPEQGYTRGPDRVSSVLRMKNAKDILDKTKNPKEIFPNFYNHTQDKGPKYDLVRAQNKLWTSSQILINLNTKTMRLYLIPGAVKFLGVDNRLPKDYESKISVKVRQYEHSPHDKYDSYVTTEPTSKKSAIKNKNIKVEQKELLLMGGAYGHMAHPFDDYALTFGELKDIIDLGLQGKLDKEEAVTEKLDGQNIMISCIDGKAKAARNKGDLKSGGMDLKGVQAKFANHIPSVRNAFVFSMQDIASSIERMNKKDQDALFNNGKNWANIEIIYPENKNVIDYDGGATIIFHGILQYNESWVPSGEVKSGGQKLADIINKLNKQIQTKFAFKGPNILKLFQVKDYAKMKSKYIGLLTNLQNIYKLKDSDELSLYHQHFWLEYILNGANSSDYSNIPDNVLYPLMKRWAFYDKSYKMTEINKLKADHPKFVEWVRATEKLDHKKMMKDNMKPFEEIFFGVGAEILANASNFLSANPTKTAEKLRNDLNSAAKSLSSKKDFSNADKLKVQLQRLKAMPDLSKAAPSEGLVFKYNGKVFKFTGFFAPINQILGLEKFSR